MSEGHGGHTHHTDHEEDHTHHTGQQGDHAHHREGVRSNVHIVGHPIHPSLVMFPVAFLTAAAVTDIVFVAGNDQFWARVSFWLVGVGFWTGLAAALVGLVDFVTIERARVHRIAWFHFLGNLGVLVLALVNWLARVGDVSGFVSPWGLVLSLATAAILGATGWAGGELSYRHMIGVTGH